MNLISSDEAAKIKNVTRQAIIAAIHRKEFNSEKFRTRTWLIVNDSKFREWEPNRIRQSARLGKGK